MPTEQLARQALRRGASRRSIGLHCRLFWPGNLRPIVGCPMSRLLRRSSCWRPVPKQPVRATPMRLVYAYGPWPEDTIAVSRRWFGSSITTDHHRHATATATAGITTDVG